MSRPGVEKRMDGSMSDSTSIRYSGDAGTISPLSDRANSSE